MTEAGTNIFESHRKVQVIAKETMRYLSTVILPGVTEKEIRKLAETYMISRGIESFWYYDVGALVFAGERTRLSISGRDYIPSDQRVGCDDLVTVDLSPCMGTSWGDYARSFIGDAHHDGIEFERYLHAYLTSNISPGMTFHDVFMRMNNEIERHGYVNLDFNGNLGHTIAENRMDRIYIEKNCMLKAGDAGLFTFEPHIGKESVQYGFKMENIYYFRNACLVEL
ncbi:MAG TPA: M24 family metallopeptidase [Spirochaetota bacterium]|nr:M24 family metallopeptidase [Spirochaetota bacterium]